MKTKSKFKNDELIQRAFTSTFTTREVEQGKRGEIIGTPIVFGQPTVIRDRAGEYIETIEPTALRSTNMKDVRLFVNHDIDKIALARSRNGNERSTMQIEIKEGQVDVKALLDIENNTEARALWSAINRGDMDGMSFMFRIKKDNWEDLESEMPKRTITDISIIHEVSVVNFPAYPQTTVSARGGVEAPYSALEEARKHKAEETAKRQSELVNIYRARNRNLFNLWR